MPHARIDISQSPMNADDDAPEQQSPAAAHSASSATRPPHLSEGPNSSSFFGSPLPQRRDRPTISYQSTSLNLVKNRHPSICVEWFFVSTFFIMSAHTPSRQKVKIKVRNKTLNSNIRTKVWISIIVFQSLRLARYSSCR